MSAQEVQVPYFAAGALESGQIQRRDFSFLLTSHARFVASVTHHVELVGRSFVENEAVLTVYVLAVQTEILDVCVIAGRAGLKTW